MRTNYLATDYMKIFFPKVNYLSIGETNYVSRIKTNEIVQLFLIRRKLIPTKKRDEKRKRKSRRFSEEH